ncbi:MAG: FimV family protein, partial [Thiohalomonadaceae bacterium]
MRKLKPFLLALLLAPAAAYPLGLGDIRLHSGLNQPLSAEIDLLSVAPDDVPSIVASLASSDAFQQIGLDRPMALMAIAFSVEQRPNGTYFIKAVSEQPMREPFLDFLLEVNWRSGRLVREYTVLLDPPELMKKEAPPAVRAPATAAKGAAGKAAPARGIAGSGKAAAATGPRTYGPVRDNETLWSIANKLRPDGSVTVPQVMMALLKGNPEAFEDNNVNRLKAGTVLRLDPALLKGMSRAQAAREVALQDRAWQDFKQQAAAEAKGRAPSGEAAVPRSAAAVKAEEPRLKLVAPETAEPGKSDASGTTDGAQALDGLRKELLLAQEASAASRQEAEELRKRVQELEGQITAMERLLSLKDDDLAA